MVVFHETGLIEIRMLFQTFYPLVARAELHEDAMPIEFMQDRKLDFVDYSKLKPFTVSIANCIQFHRRRRASAHPP